MNENQEIIGEHGFTNRGFGTIKFTDVYGHESSLQESSKAVFEGDPSPNGYLWLGINDAAPLIMAKDAIKLGIPRPNNETVGWIPYPVPEEVLMHTRMHLGESEVRSLIHHLTNWLETGNLHKEED